VRLVFLGSPPFAVPVLGRLLTSTHEVRALVTQPDRRHGRGRKSSRSPLAELAAEHELQVLQPATTKDPAFVEQLRSFEPEVLLVASYGEILRQDVLELAPRGALNVHASLLPRWRGASPIQRAILAGDAETGVSIQRMVKKLDAGDLLLSRRLTIDEHETAGELLERLAELGAEATIDALDLIASGDATFEPQDEDAVTYAGKLDKSDGVIDWTRGRAEIGRHVRAMSPWPAARSVLPDGRELVVLEVRDAEIDPSSGLETVAPGGTLLKTEGRMLVATGDGPLEIVRLKPAGKQTMEARAFLLGAHLQPGATLGA